MSSTIENGGSPRLTTPFHLMAKPVGPRCNMACRYCFYTEKQALLGNQGAARMSDEVLEAYIRGVAESQTVPELVYAWQGGEPTLAGLDFFRRAVELQRRYAGGRRVSNSLQTNGLALDDEWCSFLAEHHFLVGLSLDGPADIQNAYRCDAGGRPRFEMVWKALERLKRHGVEFNTLTVVSRVNVGRPLEVYRFLREAGVEYMQFIPLVERRPDAAARARGLQLAPPPDPAAPAGGGEVMPWCPAPAAYGEFLIAIFDEWLRRDVGRVFVQIFEVALGHWMGLGSALCQFAPTCGRALVLEANGDVYACDHYVYPAWRLGNILETPLAELVDAPAQQRFGASKRDCLSAFCRQCPWLFACGGDCPKHRCGPARSGSAPVSYLCAGYRRFFEHADPYFRRMAALMRAGLPTSTISAEVLAADRAAEERGQMGAAGGHPGQKRRAAVGGRAHPLVAARREGEP